MRILEAARKLVRYNRAISSFSLTIIALHGAEIILIKTKACTCRVEVLFQRDANNAPLL
jgi:hypothetical protein